MPQTQLAMGQNLSLSCFLVSFLFYFCFIIGKKTKKGFDFLNLIDTFSVGSLTTSLKGFLLRVRYGGGTGF